MAQAHKFRKGKSLFSTTLSSSIGTGTGDTITLGSAVGLPTDTEITLTFDRVNALGVSLGSQVERITGIISGSTLTSYTRAIDGTTDQAHSSGAIIEYIPSGDDMNDIVDGILIAHGQDGTHKTGAVYTAPDFNGTEMIIDADADSTLTADTDDQLDVKLGGSDRFRMKTSDLDIVTSTGNIQIAGADPKRAMYIPASAMYTATTSGAARTVNESSSNKINYISFDFDKDTDEYAWFSVPAPSYWDLSTITAEFHWTAESGSGTVCWGLAGLARSNDDAIDTALGTVQTTTDTLLTAGDNHLSSDTSAITIGGTPAKDDYLYFRVIRVVGSDTLTADAKLLGVVIRFGIAQYDDQ